MRQYDLSFRIKDVIVKEIRNIEVVPYWLEGKAKMSIVPTLICDIRRIIMGRAIIEKDVEIRLAKSSRIVSISDELKNFINRRIMIEGFIAFEKKNKQILLYATDLYYYYRVNDEDETKQETEDEDENEIKEQSVSPKSKKKKSKK